VGDALDYAVREPTNTLLALRGDLRFTPELSADRPYYVIEDPLRGKFYRVGVPEFTFLSLLDGKTTVARALGAAASQLGPLALAESEALGVCRWLVDCQLASTAESASVARLLDTARQDDRRRVRNRLNPLLIKIPLVNPDRLLRAAAPWCGWVFSRPFVLLWAGLCGYALCVVWLDGSHFAAAPAVIFDRDNWLRLAGVWFGLKLLHESFHGLACKHFGGTVRSAGLMLIVLTPVAFVDVNSAWRFRGKWQRIATAAAGMYVELLVAALAVIVWHETTQPALRCLCYDVALMASLHTLLFNANPLVRFDGYFILSDWLEIPNLHSCGQQYLGFLVQRRLLGWDATLPDWPPRKALLIRVYALAAIAWRVLISVTLVLALLGLFSYLGLLLSAFLVIYWHVVPIAAMLRQVFQQRSGQPFRMGRLAGAAAVLAAAVAAAVMFLGRPGTIVAPAAVEYFPLTVVRAESPGFVRAVCVRDGDQLARGQVIARLANPELQYTAADIQLALEQSAIKGRVFFRDGELAKYQVELANQESLRKKLAEAQGQVEALTVRTPVAGRVIARELDSLVGRYLSAGVEIAVVGREDVKELVLAVPQEDAQPFLAQLGKPVRFRIRGIPGETHTAPLAKLNPRALVDLPHPALGAQVGGPLPVRARAPGADRAERPDQPYELLAPRFAGSVPLTPSQSAALSAGQLALVVFHTADETAGARLLETLDRWVRQQLAQQRPGGRW